MNRTSKTTALLLALVCALALLLASCGAGGEQDQSSIAQIPDPVGSSGQGESDDGDSYSHPITDASQASLLDIVNDYLNGEQKLTDLYTVNEHGWITITETGKSIKPGAVYPYEDWTVEDISASYLNEDIPWINGWLWSSDYAHTFRVEKQLRFYVDGEYAGTVPHRQYSMDPQELIQLYQSGGWDGQELIWSEDDSTCVEVQWYEPSTVYRLRNGCLRYSFINFTEDADVRPWWENSDNYEREPEAYKMVGEGENAYLKYDEILVPLYVDLPNGELTNYTTFGDVLQIVPCSKENGVLAYTTKGIWLFKAGDLMLGWPSTDAAELLELGYQ